MKAQITNIQLALFSPGVDMSDKLAFAQKIKSKTQGLFDGDPIVLPIPNDAPAEIPRIILRNKTGQINLNISNNKIDFFIKPQDKSNELQTIFKKVEKTYQDVLKTLFESTTLVINRVGYVVNQELSVPDANKFISDHYFGIFSQEKKWQDVNLGLLKRDLIDKKSTNIWFRINPGREKNGDVDLKKLLIMFDVNTLPKEPHSFTIQDIIKYLKDSLQYLDKYSDEVIE